MSEIRCVVRGQAELGEGPAWVAAEGRIYWFDIQGRQLNWYSHAEGTAGRFDLPARASVATPCVGGGLILVTEQGLAHMDTRTGVFQLRQPMSFPPGFRTNDGKIDVAGRLWWSTMDDDGGKRPGVLYRTDPDGQTQQMLDGIHIANTVSCNPEGSILYFADSAKRKLWAFPMAADGALGERRDFVDTTGEAGAPDGSAVDAQGYVWNCQWGAWRIVRFAPDGSVDRIVTLPVEQVSSCAFGGPDLKTLYVTSARENLSDEALAAQPLAGSLFAFEPGVAGLPLPVFTGDPARMSAALLACDWGSTNLRAWVMNAGGQVLNAREFKLGVNGLAPGEAGRRFVDEVRPALGAQALPALLCGAVGSNIGWRMAPYADCPARIEDVAGGLIQPMENVWITPGLRCEVLDGACDVLRGEETQAFGWLGADPARARGRKLICQPGTHAKWLVVEDGVVTRFLSAFTGELFAVLSAHSILRNTGAGEDLATFDEGCKAAAEGDALLNRIYTARSRVAGRGADNATTGAYLSGLLIGAEVAATPRLLGLEDAPVTLLGDKALCDRYARALGARGVETDIADGDAAVRAGLVTIARLGGLI